MNHQQCDNRWCIVAVKYMPIGAAQWCGGIKPFARTPSLATNTTSYFIITSLVCTIKTKRKLWRVPKMLLLYHFCIRWKKCCISLIWVRFQFIASLPHYSIVSETCVRVCSRRLVLLSSNAFGVKNSCKHISFCSCFQCNRFRAFGHLVFRNYLSI